MLPMGLVLPLQVLHQRSHLRPTLSVNLFLLLPIPQQLLRLNLKLQVHLLQALLQCRL
jgi:hypothetical protein